MDLFQRSSTLARLHHSSFTQAARQRSVASKCESTSTATSGGSNAKSGKLLISRGVLGRARPWLYLCPITISFDRSHTVLVNTNFPCSTPLRQKTAFFPSRVSRKYVYAWPVQTCPYDSIGARSDVPSCFLLTWHHILRLGATPFIVVGV